MNQMGQFSDGSGFNLNPNQNFDPTMMQGMGNPGFNNMFYTGNNNYQPPNQQ
jgi:hypothetical protein